jgi:hypothetical protein
MVLESDEPCCGARSYACGAAMTMNVAVEAVRRAAAPLQAVCGQAVGAERSEASRLRRLVVRLVCIGVLSRKIRE